MRVRVRWREPAEERPPSPHVGFSDLCYHLTGFLQCLDMKNGGDCVHSSTTNCFWLHFGVSTSTSTECQITETSFCYWVIYLISLIGEINEGRLPLPGFILLHIKKKVSVWKTCLMTYLAVYDWHWILSLQSIVTLDKSVTLSMSAASLRLWAMSSDSVSRSFSRVVLYNWPTSSLCRQSFTWFTRKCITAFGTLRPNNNNRGRRQRKEKTVNHMKIM